MAGIFLRVTNKAKRATVLLLCLLLWVLGRVLLRYRRLPALPKDKIERVLIFAWGGIGNVVLLTPVLKNLRAALPKAHICIVVNPNGSKEVLDGSPWIDEIVVQQETGLKDIYRNAKKFRACGKCTLSLCMVGIDPIMATLYAFLSAAQFRVGEKGRREGFLYTYTIPVKSRMHEVERNLDLLRVLAFPVEDKETVFWLPADIRSRIALQLEKEIGSVKRIIAMAPGSGAYQVFKRWPKEHFAKVASWCIERGFTVLLLGDADERQLCEDIMAAAGNGVYSMAGKFSLKETAAALSLSRLMISNDSALMHVSAALKVPVVAVFGPTLAYKNAPWKTPCRIVTASLSCAPCYNFQQFSCDRGIACLSELSADKVIQAIQELHAQTRCLD